VTKAGVFRLDCGEIPVMAGGKGGGCQLGLLHYYVPGGGGGVWLL